MKDNIWEDRRGPSAKRTGDMRSEWARDYARLIHSPAFRRLQSKTQVLGLGESDFYRTRLTHSMEVSQIGVGIVRALQVKHRGQDEIIEALPSTALMSAICLAHDIGHPPFGHGGEVALNLCMRDYGGFEGNGQTLRILSRLDKYTAEHGMNPTRRLLLGVLKYPVSYSDTVQTDIYGKIPSPTWQCKAKEQRPPKCYLDDEKDVVDWILEPFTLEERTSFTKLKPKSPGKLDHLKPMHKGLDTSIMELADDISYSLHDLEDAISLGMITQPDWDAHNHENEFLFTDCDKSASELSEQLFSDESYKRKEAIGALVHMFILSTEVHFSGIDNATTSLIKWNAYMEAKHEALLNHIFTLVKDKVIKSVNVQQLEFKGQKLVIELFETLSSDPERLLPANTLKRLPKLAPPTAADNEKKINAAQRARHICDFVSGMTDEYATRLYEKLHYPHKGSIFDQL